MKPLTIKSIFFFKFCINLVISIRHISNYRMSYRRHVNADLMRTTSQKIDFYERILSFHGTKDSESSLGNFWIHRTYDRHLRTIVLITTDIRLDISLLFRKQSNDKREILLFYRSFIHHPLKLKHRSIIFRYHKKPARIFIESMHETRSFDA